MLEWIQTVDTRLLLILNAGAANPFCDWLMPIVTDIRFLLPVVSVGLAALAVFGGGKGRSVVLLAVILLGLTDLVSSDLIKPWVGRVRPCHVVAAVRAIYRCGNTLSFPSGHATGTMAAAVFIGSFYRRGLWPLLALSFLISYSRIYLGIHYPLDVVGGWVLGGTMATGAVLLHRTRLRRLFDRVRLLRVQTNGAQSVP
ncbi:MAG: phosphatase PAP2 family protein [candidate division Zixibacteria bacterium]|nr:phosphatase PAP2 family protein [candidate division Zixibacteria bacterium]